MKQFPVVGQYLPFIDSLLRLTEETTIGTVLLHVHEISLLALKVLHAQSL